MYAGQRRYEPAPRDYGRPESDYRPQSTGYPWAGGPPYPVQRRSPEQVAPVSGWVPRGAQPRHGHPRGYEQQPAGYDTPAPRRGAHSMPEDDAPARPGYDAPAAYGYGRQAYGPPAPPAGRPAPPRARQEGDGYRGYGDDRWSRPDGYPSRPARPVSGAAPYPTSGAARYATPISAPAHHATSAPPRPTYPTAGYPPPPAPYREAEIPRSGAGWAPTSGGAGAYPPSRAATDPRLRAHDGHDIHGRHPQSDLLTPSGNIPRYVDPPGNRPAAVGFAFGFTPLSLVALILGIVGLVRSKAAGKGRGLAIAAIVMSLGWLPVTYLAATHVLGQAGTKSSAVGTPAPSTASSSPPGYDPGCAAGDAAAFTFNKNLQAHANDAAKLLVDFKTAATALNAAAAQSAKPAATTAMKRLASDLTSIYTALSKGTTPNGAVMNRLGSDGSAIDKACGKK